MQIEYPCGGSPIIGPDLNEAIWDYENINLPDIEFEILDSLESLDK